MADRRSQATVKRVAIFVKERGDGCEKYIRRPYDVVEYFWGNAPPTTYIQPCMGRPLSRSEVDERYDDVRFYSTPPPWDLVSPSGR
jgi:hypothetical protein